MDVSDRLDAAIDDARRRASDPRPLYNAVPYWEALRNLLAAVEEYRLAAAPLFREREIRPSPYVDDR